MREIKFRAWHPEWSEMIIADFTPTFDKRSFFAFEFGVGFSHYPQDDRWVLMQFTGLKDKNGKEIYEGDLIRLTDKFTYDVRFEDAKFVCYHVNNDWGRWGDLKRLSNADFLDMHYEIIGNIYENPDLLTKNSK